jgi:nicotinamidase-related amidase
MTKQQPQPMTQPRNYPETLLDPRKVAIAIIDHQPQMYFGVGSAERCAIINNASMLIETSKVFGIPLVLTTVEAKEFSGDMITQLTDLAPGNMPIDRTTINAWEDTSFKKAIEQTGRRDIILAGLWTEACVTFPALTMHKDGYKVYVAADACGGATYDAHQTAIMRMNACGIVPMTTQQILLELQRDWANKDTYNKVMQVVQKYGGAYGLGVEYAQTMVTASQPPQGQSGGQQQSKAKSGAMSSGSGISDAGQASSGAGKSSSKNTMVY